MRCVAQPFRPISPGKAETQQAQRQQSPALLGTRASARTTSMTENKYPCVYTRTPSFGRQPTKPAQPCRTELLLKCEAGRVWPGLADPGPEPSSARKVLPPEPHPNPRLVGPTLARVFPPPPQNPTKRRAQRVPKRPAPVETASARCSHLRGGTSDEASPSPVVGRSTSERPRRSLHLGVAQFCVFNTTSATMQSHPLVLHAGPCDGSRTHGKHSRANSACDRCSRNGACD